MRAVIPTHHVAAPVAGNTFLETNDAARPLLESLFNLAENSDSLIAGSIGEFYAGEKLYHIPRFIFMGPRGGGDTIRLGIFAAIRGDEPQGAEAIVSFLQQLESHPDLATGYHIYTYPVCNPSGFAAGTRNNAARQDLTKHFWRGSDQPEAYYLEREMGVHQFQGVISLGSTDDFNPRYSFAGGRNSILCGALVSPAMLAMRLSLAQAPLENGGSNTLSSKHSEADAAGILTRTSELHPVPFEINFGIPRQAPRQTQVVCTVNALKSILDSYRTVLAIQQNI